MVTKVILADIDGTLIERGIIENCPNELRKTIRKIKNEGVLFSMASGRDYPFMKKAWKYIVELPELHSREALLYEDVCIKLGNGATYILGGLDKKTLELINKIESENPKTFEGLVHLPGNNFTVRTARVTSEFASGQKTEGRVKEKLERRYSEILRLFDTLKTKPEYLSSLENITIRKSADAIDFVDKKAHKGVAFEKYVGLLSEFGIYGNEIAVIGDAENDEEILISVLRRGGIAGFVGKNKSLEKKLREIKEGSLIIPYEKGPIGTAEIIRSLI